MEWGDLQYFLAVARTGRLATAARGLGVEHTTVGRRLAALEHSLGTPLFHRTAAGWRLTRVGEQILPRAEAMEEQARSLRATSLAAASVAAGRVRIAAIESWGADLLAPNLAALHARHPELQVEILTGQAHLSLTRGEADVAFRVPKPTQPDLSATCFAEGTFCLMGTPALVERWSRAIDADQAAGVPLAIFTPEMEFIQSAPWFRALREVADIRARSSSTLTLLALAHGGDMLAVAPRFLAGRDPRIRRAGRRDISRHRMWVAAHKDVRREPRVAAVFQWTRDVIGPYVQANEAS